MHMKQVMSDSPGSLSPAQRRRSIAAAIACISVFSITTGFASPLISLILESRDVSRSVIGTMASVPSFAILVSTPFIPRLVAKIGIRRFISVCIGLEFVLFLLLPLFDNLVAWFVIRAIMGASGSGLFVASETWINAVAQERTRGRVLAIYGMIISGSFGVGPALIPIVGIDGYAPFVIGAVFIALASIPLVWAGHLSPAFEGRSRFGLIAFLFVAPTLTAAIWLSAFKEMALSSLLPVYGVRNGLSSGDAAMMLTAFAVGAVLLQYPIGWLADRINRYGLLIACAIGGGLGAALLPTMLTMGGAVLWVGLLIWGGIFSGLYTVAMVLVGQRFRGPELVTANAAIGFLWGAGALTGPTAAGVAMDIWDPGGLSGIVTTITCMFIVFAIGRRIQVINTRNRNHV